MSSWITVKEEFHSLPNISSLAFTHLVSLERKFNRNVEFHLKHQENVNQEIMCEILHWIDDRDFKITISKIAHSVVCYLRFKTKSEAELSFVMLKSRLSPVNQNTQAIFRHLINKFAVIAPRLKVKIVKEN